MRQNLAELLGKRLLLSLGDFQPRQFGNLLDFLLRDFHNYHSLRMFKMVAFSPTHPGAPKHTPLPRKAAGCPATEAYLLRYVAGRWTTENEAGGHFQHPTTLRSRSSQDSSADPHPLLSTQQCDRPGVAAVS